MRSPFLMLVACLSALPFLEAQCTISGQKAFPTPSVDSSSTGCATSATLFANRGGVATLTVPSSVSNPFPLFEKGVAWSFSMWVKPSSSTTKSLYLVVVQSNTGFDCSGQILSLQIGEPSASGWPRIGQCNNAGISFNSTVTFDAWNHLVYQYDGASSFQVYLNGVSLGFATGSVFTPLARSPVTNVYLNAPVNGGYNEVLGSLSTIRLYKFPLSACQVLSDFAGLRQPGLVAEYISQYSQTAAGNFQLTDATQSNPTYFQCSFSDQCSVN